eukprot:Skav232684  [mRNA]  locus=scaffold698:519164:519767:- [translate_table: standard]
MEMLDVKPDLISFASAITACEKSCQWEEGLQLLFLAAEGQVQLDVVTFSSAISCCEKAGEWQSALDLLHCMMEDEESAAV